MATPPPGYSVKGIDVSSHDHDNGKTVDWPTLAANGLNFAYVKATEGTNYTNPYFDSDYHGAKDNGIYVGAYAYGRPDKGNPAGQADYFYSNMQWTAYGKTLTPFVDMEWPWFSDPRPQPLPAGSPPWSCYGLTVSQMRTWLHGFLDELQAQIGRPPMIYTNINWWNPCVGNDPSFASYLLDIASCTNSAPVPAPWTHWTIWQYDIPDCDSSLVNDQDVFNGDLTALAQFAGTAVPSTPATVKDLNGKLTIFATASDGALLHGWQTHPGTGPWGFTALANNVTGVPAVTQDVNHKLVYFARTTDGRLIHGWQGVPGSGPWLSTTLVASGVAGDPVATRDVSGKLVYVVRMADGSLLHGWQGAPGSGPWLSTTLLTSGVAGDPAVATDVSGKLVYLVRMADGSLLHAWQNTPGHGPWLQTPLVNGNVASDPGVTLDVSGKLVYFVALGGGSILHGWQSSPGTAPWYTTVLI